jgi:hypothetical protein
MTGSQSRGPVPGTGIILIFLAFLGLGILYSVTVPLFEAPDEDGHYTYLKYVAQTRRLPAICLDSADCLNSRIARRTSRITDPVSPYVINHPPLYYALAGLATSWLDLAPLKDAVHYNPHFDYGVRGLRGNKNAVIHTSREAFPYQGTSLAVHIGRWVSLLLGSGAVWGTYLLALELFPDQRWLALGAAAITAFNPQFLFVSVRLGNDAAVAGFCCLTLWITVRFLNREQSQTGVARWWQPIGMGGFLGLALLSKVNAVGLLPVVALAILLKALRHGSLRSFVQWSGVTFGVCMAIAGWWYLRNGLLYSDPLLWNVHLELVPRRAPAPTLGELYQHEFGGLETSFWAVFGWMNISVHEWIYRVLRIMSRVATLGLVLLIVRRVAHRLKSSRRGGPSIVERGSGDCVASRLLPHTSCNQPGSVVPGGEERIHGRARGDSGILTVDRDGPPYLGLGIAVLWLIILLLSLLQFMRVQPGAQGRYLFPGISAISLLLLLGLSQWVPRPCREQGVHDLLTGVIAGSLFLLAILCPFVYIAPAYAHPAILSPGQLPDDLGRLEINLGDRVALLGAKVGRQALHPGQKAEVTLCWESLAEMDEDYSVFLHLLGRGNPLGEPQDRERVGQLDIYPGVGAYPTTLWQVGDIVCDDYEIPISSQATAPVAADVEVGLYERESMERLPALDGAGQLVGQVIVARVKVIPFESPQYEMETSLRFEVAEKFALRGYDLAPTQVRPGDELLLTLYWQVLEQGDQDYTVFVHLVDREGRMWDQADAQPLSGEYPTSFWGRGEIIQDSYVLSLPPQAPPGDYSIELGMYLLATGERMPVRDAEEVRMEGDRIQLAPVRVVVPGRRS